MGEEVSWTEKGQIVLCVCVCGAVVPAAGWGVGVVV